jgi:hypothetical protein
MLIYEDFSETSQIQASVFTPGFMFSTSEVLKRLMQLELDVFDGDPLVLPLPEDAPHEIPRITLENKEKTFKLEVAPSRINFFRSMTSEEDRIIPNDFVQVAGKTLTSLLDKMGAQCGRIAAVVNRFAFKGDPGKEIAAHFCKDNFLREPFDQPSEFELHSLKKYDFFGSFKVNSWVRIKSGQMKFVKGLSRPVVVALQDINTLAEETESYSMEQITSFYEKICDEFDKVLRLYFPK